MLVNNSQWPTPALEVITRWLTQRMGITWVYTVRLSNTRHRRFAWRGRGGKYSQWCFLNRRWGKCWPYYNTYWKATPNVTYRFNTRFELLIFLLSHEAAHATVANPQQWIRDTGGMEHCADATAYVILQAFRAEWPSIKRTIYHEMRVARAAKKVEAHARFKMAARTWTPKSSLAEAMRRRQCK